MKFLKYLIILIVSVLLVTVSIDAADHRGDMKESIAGRLIFGGASGPCPEGMVVVEGVESSFCIDQYEASAGPDCPFLNPASFDNSNENINSAKCKPVSAKGAKPWVNVSQLQALEICAKAGKRLPTNKEWYDSALGTPDLEENWGTADCQVSNNWESQPGLTGSAENCQSGAGVYDMIGNVWEWVSGQVEDGKYNGQDIPSSGYVKMIDQATALPTESGDQPDINFNKDYVWTKSTGMRAFARGGYWNNQADAGKNAIYLEVQPTYVGEGIGFRCVKAVNK